MRNFKKILCVFLSILMIGSCMSIAVSADETDSLVGTKGTFNILNFNVGGTNSSLFDAYIIGDKLNNMKYDIITVQEDFSMSDALEGTMTNYANRPSWDISSVGERHHTVHSGDFIRGDGLNIFSVFPLYNEYRIPWEVSSDISSDGSVEIPNNGILVTTLKLAEGYYVDVYDIHADAFDDTASENARKAQYTQLANYIKKHSVYDEATGTYDHAVIVTGDFNSSICYEDSAGDPYLLSLLIEAAHLNDAWAVNQISEIKEDPDDYSAYYTYAKETDLSFSETHGHYDSYERICYADGNGIDLSCDSFKYLQISEDDMLLSDHFATEAEFSYNIVDKDQDSTHNHDKENVAQEKDFLMILLEYIASIFQAIGKLIASLGNGLV